MHFKDLVNIAIAKSMGNYRRQKGGYSITELITSPRLTHLRRRYAAYEPTPTFESHFSPFKGNAIHNEMKRGLYAYKKEMEILYPEEAEKIFVEYRLIDKIHGRHISGQPDLIISPKLWDYKTKKAWSAAYMDDIIKKWEKQANGYIYLASDYGIEVIEAAIGTMYLDWNKFSAEKNPLKYPQIEVDEVPLRVWTPNEQKKFIEDSVEQLVTTEEVPDDQLPPCTTDDTWERTTYRLGKKGGTRAIKIFSDSGAAYAKRASYKNPDDYVVIPKKSEAVFCRDYCWCREFCNQWKDRGHGQKTEDVPI